MNIDDEIAYWYDQAKRTEARVTVLEATLRTIVDVWLSDAEWIEMGHPIEIDVLITPAFDEIAR